eukprot:1834175-Pleurochrysis_carterae.AAC.1
MPVARQVEAPICVMSIDTCLCSAGSMQSSRGGARSACDFAIPTLRKRCKSRIMKARVAPWSCGPQDERSFFLLYTKPPISHMANPTRRHRSPPPRWQQLLAATCHPHMHNNTSPCPSPF